MTLEHYKPGISVIIASWNTYPTVKTSVERLIEEASNPSFPCYVQIIICDNGSTDKTNGLVTDLLSRKLADNVSVTSCRSPVNRGSSVQRNRGLANARFPYVFFLDGDIEYVNDTLLEYVSVLETLRSNNDKIIAVGHNNPYIVQTTGINGIREKGDIRIAKSAYQPLGTEVTATTGYPMAWVQYGLFWLPDNLKGKLQFPTEAPFGEPGHGYEDDWLYSLIEEQGLEVAYVEYPIYYHDANKGLRNLQEEKVDTRFTERRETYFKRWGHYGFVHRLQTGAYRLKQYILKR